MVERPNPCPALIAVDDDVDALRRTTRELTGRYGADYRVVCERSATAALALLEEMRAAGQEVAVVLADQWLPQVDGIQLLARAKAMHPGAKRALMIDWGAWGHRPTADAIFKGMAVGHIDYYVVKPMCARDEQFHRLVTEFLYEWARGRSPRASEITVVCEERSARAHELRNVLTRNGVPFIFLSSGSPEGRDVLDGAGQTNAEVPVVVIRDGRVLVDPSTAEIAAAFGVDTELEDQAEYDVVVVGAGPAGLTAAVYASSEGLRTLVVERESIGGQAGSSSLIRNYLGFSRGVSGAELAQRAYQQAWVFGTRFLLMRELTAVRAEGDGFSLSIPGAGTVLARAVILASGVSYRRLDVPELEELVGAGVFYGASISEAPGLAGEAAYVVGGGNSAGQTALHLSRYAREVTLVVRRARLAESMSQYLRDALDGAGNVRIRCQSEVVGGGGEAALDHLILRSSATGETTRVDAAGLFILIGARPHTDWLPDSVERDPGGYVVTGSALVRAGSVIEGWPLPRPPLMMETSVPGLFAVGDVRHGSTTRVASAVGDGAVVVEQIHRLLTPSEPELEASPGVEQHTPA